jgi:hypothetical protein
MDFLNRLLEKLRKGCCRFFPVSDTGTAMLFALVLSMVGALVMGSLMMTSRLSSKKSQYRRENIAALNIAEAGKEKTLAELRGRNLDPAAGQKITPYADVSFGTGAYTVTCSTNAAADTAYIVSTGVCNQDTARLAVIATLGPGAAWSKWVKGAVTARTAVSTLGDITIDGRDHDTTGALTGTGGTYGVCAGGSVSVGGSSQIGGGTTAPQQPGIEGVTVQSNIDTTGYPQTPEEILGLSAGALDSFKISGCPESISGIMYTEEEECKKDPVGEGILIYHNSGRTAGVKNFHGNFKGLVIMDQVKHVNAGAMILGAVMMLGIDVAGNCFGNGKANIHYSSQMLGKVTQSLPATSGRRTVTVVSWREM